MTDEEFRAELNRLCGNGWKTNPNGKVSIPCPREHKDMHGDRNPAIIFGRVTGFGQCDSCGLKVNSEERLFAMLKESHDADGGKFDKPALSKQKEANCDSSPMLVSPVVFSDLLIRKMKALELASAEFVFVSYLTSGGFSWEGNCVVSSSLKEMHRTTGLATGTIHKAKDGLIEKGLVQILNTRNKERTNTYNLLPLRERLAEFAEWKLPATPEPTVDGADLSPQS